MSSETLRSTLKQVHKNGSVGAFTQALFVVAREVRKTHGMEAATSALVAAAQDLGLLPELRRSLDALQGRE